MDASKPATWKNAAEAVGKVPMLIAMLALIGMVLWFLLTRIDTDLQQIDSDLQDLRLEQVRGNEQAEARAERWLESQERLIDAVSALTAATVANCYVQASGDDNALQYCRGIEGR